MRPEVLCGVEPPLRDCNKREQSADRRALRTAVCLSVAAMQRGRPDDGGLSCFSVSRSVPAAAAYL